MNKLFHLLVFTSLLNFAFPTLECKSDTIVWSGNIELITDTLFNQQQTLIVLPGTIVTALGSYKIEIRGNIVAEGLAENPILFTAFDTVEIQDSATATGGWHGIHLLDNQNGYAKFKHCRFEYGKANIPGSWTGMSGFNDTLGGNQGGAIRIVNYKVIEFEDCMFYKNFSRTRGGAIYCDNIQSIKVIACEFLDNSSMAFGGAIYCSNHDSLSIMDNSFKRNIANLNWGSGGALYVKKYIVSSINLINNNTFFNNSSKETVKVSVSNLLFINNLLTNNNNMISLFFGLLDNSSHIFNNTIAHNYGHGYGGVPGIFTSSIDMNIYNNIVWNNLSDTIEPDDLVIDWLYYQPVVDYNLIWEGRSIGEHMITEDPLFINPAPGYGLDCNGWEYNWSLSDASPAINTGTLDTVGLNLPPFDLAGNLRVFGNRIDMGAYENQNVYVHIVEPSDKDEEISIYPNPGNRQLFIEVQPGMEGSWLELVDATGKQLLHSQIASIPAVFSLTSLKPGIYFYRIHNQQKIIKTGKWVKQ